MTVTDEDVKRLLRQLRQDEDSERVREVVEMMLRAQPRTRPCHKPPPVVTR